MPSHGEVSSRHDVVVIGAGPTVRARAREVSEQLRLATLERIRERDVHLVPGEARLEAEHTVVVRAGSGAETRLHAEATIEDVIRMAYNTPSYTYGYKLAASDVLTRMHPDVLRGMRLLSRAHRI